MLLPAVASCCLERLTLTPATARYDWAHLGHVIRRIRRERGIKRQPELAEAVGLSAKTISNYENGRKPETPGIPDGYHLVAKHFGWPPGCLEFVLAGGEPEEFHPGSGPSGAHALAKPAFDLLDAARDAGAPAELIQRGREDITELMAWLLQAEARRSSLGLAAYRPHAAGEGPAADDTARILRALEE
ncbi:helix-turn-helix domain-containing protein [Streptomyces sp. XC 2026]|uniref:helix-turn-helix domain-containing protein n=1 Tax=Streptomyces sp. XC 2026 TaxID=2782004 RepID=UPI0019056E9A|nr:helix-turn-helix transcriptional regulator [Streptomyces sp. XC 2026]QQN79780.1 helix-turn-helix transcriptional regulator [Streptomyces sp. XC 2026]QQN80612.1 helix-turn-helix transcriptional regulator [Streptomyces sp. XC 2026]